jgi:hypothetical protein
MDQKSGNAKALTFCFPQKGIIGESRMDRLGNGAHVCPERDRVVRSDKMGKTGHRKATTIKRVKGSEMVTKIKRDYRWVNSQINS